jgi:hypothetical protein
MMILEPCLISYIAWCYNVDFICDLPPFHDSNWNYVIMSIPVGIFWMFS